MFFGNIPKTGRGTIKYHSQGLLYTECRVVLDHSLKETEIHGILLTLGNSVNRPIRRLEIVVTNYRHKSFSGGLFPFSGAFREVRVRLRLAYYNLTPRRAF